MYTRRNIYPYTCILVGQFILILLLLNQLFPTIPQRIIPLKKYEPQMNNIPEEPFHFFQLHMCGHGMTGFQCENDTTCNRCLDSGDPSDWIRKFDVGNLQKYADQFTSNKTVMNSIKDFISSRYSRDKPIILMITSTFYSKDYAVFVENMACILDSFGVGDQLLILVMTNEEYDDFSASRLKDFVLPISWSKDLKNYYEHSSKILNDMDRVLYSLRWHIISLLVQWEYSVLMQDADMLWVSNPIPVVQEIIQHEKSDFLMQWAPRHDLFGPGCAGFVYVNGQSVRKKIVKLFFRTIQNVLPYMRVFVRSSDQGLINAMVKNQFFRELSFRTTPQEWISNLITVNGKDVGIGKDTIVAHAISGSGIEHKKRRMKDSNLWRFDEVKKECI